MAYTLFGVRKTIFYSNI